MFLVKEALKQFEVLRSQKLAIDVFEPARCLKQKHDKLLIESLDAHLKPGDLASKHLESWVEDMERIGLLQKRYRQDIDVPLMRDNFVDNAFNVH